jgi:hypothetical protein
MPAKRMNREQFYDMLATLDEQRLQKALWNLYWRGSAAMRERIEAELDPAERDRVQRAARQAPDPKEVLDEAAEFAMLARSGAYMGGDRRVTPKERTRWRFTFQRLVRQAQDALRAEEVETAADAVAVLVDLACELRDYNYFRSEDPLEAAQFVVSDAAALLWGRLQDHFGFSGFAERAAPQLIRWESKYGWSRSGWGRLSARETSLAKVLTGMLRVPDTWTGFADRYLDALDQVARDDKVTPANAWRSAERVRDERTAALAEWHLVLFQKLVGSEAEDRVGRLARHRALGGPELKFLQARLADQRGDVTGARGLMQDALEKLPGHPDFIDFALEIGVDLPPYAQQIVKQRATPLANAAGTDPAE